MFYVQILHWISHYKVSKFILKILIYILFGNIITIGKFMG